MRVPPYIFIFITVFLGLVRLVHPRKINPTPERPPIEVIIPAFNEELNIAELLGTIDAAAGRYEGPVRVLMCDDGSTDGTSSSRPSAIAAFRTPPERLSRATTRASREPLIGAVSMPRRLRVPDRCRLSRPPGLLLVLRAPLPWRTRKWGWWGRSRSKEPYETWIDRMRMFEMIVGFGMGRPASDVVDGVAAYPVRSLGSGAMQRWPSAGSSKACTGRTWISRAPSPGLATAWKSTLVSGRTRTYRTPSVSCVFRGRDGTGVGPWPSPGTFRLPRGLAGPRFWFFMTRSSFKRFLVPLHITTLGYVIVLAIFNPTSHLNLARVLFVLLFKAVPALVQVIGCTVYYGKARRLGWLPLRYGFVLLKHYYGLEAFLSFNARPVVTDRVREALYPGHGLRPCAYTELTESYS